MDDSNQEFYRQLQLLLAECEEALHHRCGYLETTYIDGGYDLRVRLRSAITKLESYQLSAQEVQ